MHSGNKRQSKSGAGKGQRGVGGAGAPPSTGYHLIGLPLSVSAGGRSAAISQKREGSLIGRSCIDRPRPPAQEVHRGGTWHLLDGRSLACISGNVSGRPAPDTAGILQPRSTRHKAQDQWRPTTRRRRRFSIDFRWSSSVSDFRRCVGARNPSPGPRTQDSRIRIRDENPPPGKAPDCSADCWPPWSDTGWITDLGDRGQTPTGAPSLSLHRHPRPPLVAHSRPPRRLPRRCSPPPREGRG